MQILMLKYFAFYSKKNSNSLLLKCNFLYTLQCQTTVEIRQFHRRPLVRLKFVFEQENPTSSSPGYNKYGFNTLLCSTCIFNMLESFIIPKQISAFRNTFQNDLRSHNLYERERNSSSLTYISSAFRPVACVTCSRNLVTKFGIIVQ